MVLRPIPILTKDLYHIRLEQALRYFSVLSKGDIIEVSFSMLTFEFLIVEITPEGPGINIIDTDLEVNFALKPKETSS